MSVLDSLCTSVGLLWDRLHIIFSDTEQTTGVTSTWMQDLQSLDERAVPAGSLVELIVSLEHARPEAAQPKIRFDVLEFDWLFTGGFDDPVASLKTPAADPPIGGFTVLDREVAEKDFSGGQRTLEEVVSAYRISNATDFESRLLIVRESDLPDIG